MKNNIITQIQYQVGLFDVCDSLMTDFLKFLKDEGRYKFRMIKIIDNMLNLFSSVYNQQSEEEEEACERVLYLTRKPIIKEYRRLRIKKLSPADSILCIIKKTLEVSKEKLPLSTIYDEKGDEIYKIVMQLFDNIRNKGKYYKQPKFEKFLKDAIEKETWGKLRAQELDIYSIEHPGKKKQEVYGEKDNWGVTGREIEL